MQYLQGMEQLGHEIMDKVLKARDEFNCDNVLSNDVRNVLQKDKKSMIKIYKFY